MFRRYWPVVVLMLFLANAINYLDRSAFSIAAPVISKALHLNAAELGILFSAFFVGYALFNFVGGYLADLYGPRKVFSGAMTLWSVFCGLTAVAFNFISMFFVRLVFGFGEGPLASTTNKTISNWVPKDKHARAVGVAFAGSPIGGAIAGPIVGLVAVHSGWKISFLVITLIGLVWALIWWKLVTDDPRQHPRVSSDELAEIGDSAMDSGTAVRTVPSGERTPLSYYMRQPTILFTAVAFFAYNYILFFFLTWFPSYLSTAKHLSISKMSMATTIPWVVGTVGLILSGWVSDFLYQKTGKLMFSRKVVIVCGLLGAAVCVGLTGTVQTAASAVVLMTFGIFFMYITGAMYWSIIRDNVNASKVGGASGFVHALSNISGIIAPSVTGFIVQFTGSFTSAFLLAGLLAVIGAVCVLLFVKPLRSPSAVLSESGLEGTV